MKASDTHRSFGCVLLLLLLGAADRYSIAFFSHPNNDVDVSPLPSCVTADNPAHYPTDTPVSAGAYLQMKLGATY